MEIWTDGLHVLLERAWMVFGILGLIMWGQVLVSGLFKKTFKERFSTIEYFSLGTAGWILPAALWALAFFAGKFLFAKAGEAVVSILALVAFLYAMVWGRPKRTEVLTAGLIVIALGISIVLRLAFLETISLPLYFDSAEHYRIIKYFLISSHVFVPEQSSPSYYHIGFHIILAAIARFFHRGIVETMLPFGQITLAILPFSFFFIVKQETQSNRTAAFACLLAGFGWHMPSHLMNWGKYPALLSLQGIFFVLNMGYLMYRNKEYRSLLLYGLLGFGILLTTLIHTRALIVFACMALSMLLTMWRNKLSAEFQHILFALVVGVISTEIFFIQKSDVLSLLFGAYLRDDLWMLLLIAALMFFSIKFYPELTFFLLASFFLLMIGLFISFHLTGLGTLTLLDRPYVQMLLYLPLSFFGGLGLAGLRKYLQEISRLTSLVINGLTLLVFFLVIFNAGLHQHFYPSDCCQIAREDDNTVMEWMDVVLPEKTRVLIASTDLYVTAFETGNPLAGVDGGIWITPLISRETVKMRWDIDFTQLEIHNEICRRKISYIYVGGAPESFNVPQLASQTDWYSQIFALPKARVYQVLGCE